MPGPNLTERQQKWFATIRAGLERDTGRSMAEWVAIARTCPEDGHRARLKWLKDHHGLLQNRGSQVLAEAFGAHMAWSEPEKLIGTNTIGSVQSGLYYGALGLIDSIVERLLEKLGPETKVIATGGQARLISRDSRFLKVVDENLTLEGLELIWNRERARR